VEPVHLKPKLANRRMGSYDTNRHEHHHHMHGNPHPTAKTLAAKLQAAKEALAAGRLVPVDAERHVNADLEELDIDESTYWALIPRLIQAALDAGPQASYAGTRPPRKSTKHALIMNQEMWAFKATLPEFDCPLYFKFVLKSHPKTQEIFFYHVDCHPDHQD
jgi:hypothetical protein